jgi:hypothetical protein
MPSFEDAVLRLKQRLGVSRDKAVAELLGLTDKAFNARKRRGVFPEDKLRAAAQAHPEWALDVDYVLTGESAREDVFERQMRVLKAASVKTAALLLPEREQRFVRDIVWGVEMDKPAFLLTTIEEFVAERVAESKSAVAEAAPPTKPEKAHRTKHVIKGDVGAIQSTETGPIRNTFNIGRKKR